MTAPMTALRSIVIERRLPHAPDKVWRVLTEAHAHRAMADAERLPADRRPPFHLQGEAEAIGDWDGIVRCEVLACEPNRLLRYSWVGGAAGNKTYGSLSNSTVTWTLTPVDGGTHLRMEHAGFRSPDNDFAYEAMSPGWGGIAERLEQVVAALWCMLIGGVHGRSALHELAARTGAGRAAARPTARPSALRSRMSLPRGRRSAAMCSTIAAGCASTSACSSTARG